MSVVQLEPEPQVRLVGAVAVERLVIGDPPHRQGDLDAALAQHERQEALVQVDHVVGVDEGHLDVQLREVRLPVGAQILVPEAARDLKIPLEPADHEKLLEELGRLRQRVEGALLEAARDQEVTSALGRRPGQDRRLDLDESLARQELPHGRAHLVAELERLPHPVPAQVEVAVAESGLLAHLTREGLDLEGRGLGVGEQPGVPHPDLDLAGRQVRVDGLRRATHHRAGGGDHVLGSQLVPELESLAGLVGVEDQLHQPGAVPQVDEDEAAVVAAAVDPAGHAHLGVDPVGQHLAAPGVSVLDSAADAGNPSLIASRLP